MRERLGYYTYTVTAEQRLDILNLALAYGIETYGESEMSGYCSVRISFFDSAKWESALKAAGVSYSRGELRGLLGFFRRIGKHPGLIAGVAVALFLYVWLGGVVWEVRIQSENDIDEDIVLSELAESGLYEGVWAAKVDPDRVVAEFLSKDSDVAFATVHMRGVIAEVELIQRDTPPKTEPTRDPCNLVASRDAVITDMTVYAGKPSVKVGQTVAAGDLLVTGVLTDVGGTRLLPATATVMGRVEDMLEIEVPFSSEGYRVVSSHPAFYSLTLFGHTLTIGRRESADCVSERRLFLFDRIRLPFIARIGYRTETASVTVVRCEEEAKNIAEAELRRRLAVLLEEGALDSCETAFSSEEGVLILRARVIYETNIAKALAFDAQTQ